MSKRLKKCTLCLRGADSDTDEPITHPGKRKKTITNSGQDNQKSLPCRQGDALGSNMAAVVATQRYSSIEVDNPAPKTSDEEDVEHTDVVQTKRRFKTPKLKSIRKIFKWRARKAKSLGDAELEVGVAGNLSKSSGELSQQEEDRLKPGSPSTTGLSLSHDSVFNPDQQKIPSPAFKPETTVSVENIPAGFTSELSAKLRLRAGSSSEDDGLGPTADVTLTTNDVLSEKNEPRVDSKRDSGILSMDDEKSLNSSPLGDRKRKMFATKKSRSTTSSTDLDLDLIVSSSQLSNAAALHKRSVAPKARRASSRSRLSQRSVVSQSGLSITSEKLEDIAENPKSRTPPHVSTEHIAKKDRPPSVEISREIKEVKSISISSTQEKENEKIVKMERPSSVEISKEIKEVKSISISSTQKKENEKIVKMERPSSVEISKEIKELKSVSSTEENKEEKIRASPDKEFLSEFLAKTKSKDIKEETEKEERQTFIREITVEKRTETVVKGTKTAEKSELESLFQKHEQRNRSASFEPKEIKNRTANFEKPELRNRSLTLEPVSSTSMEDSSNLNNATQETSKFVSVEEHQVKIERVDPEKQKTREVIIVSANDSSKGDNDEVVTPRKREIVWAPKIKPLEPLDVSEDKENKVDKTSVSPHIVTPVVESRIKIRTFSERERDLGHLKIRTFSERRASEEASDKVPTWVVMAKQKQQERESKDETEQSQESKKDGDDEPKEEDEIKADKSVPKDTVANRLQIFKPESTHEQQKNEINKKPTAGRKTWVAPKTENCIICGNRVYMTEMVKAEGRVFHKSCQKCTVCNRTLMIGNLILIQNSIYCRMHGAEIKAKQLDIRSEIE